MNSSWLPNAEDSPTDDDLCARAVGDDRLALEALVKRHQRWVYNLALRLVLSPVDAEDLSQEAFVRIITRLSQFQGTSSFRTWAYRIVVNCFIDGKRRKMESLITTFAAYGEELDSLGSAAPPSLGPEQRYLIEEAKVGCMLGMLLCLDRHQRAAYVLGEIVGAKSAVAAEILGVSPAAYRKRLERARRDLVSFMNDKCGLVNEANPCRCEKKTQSFIKAGWVDPEHLKFSGKHVQRLKVLAAERAAELCTLEQRAASFFREHPVVNGPDLTQRISALVNEAKLPQVAFNIPHEPQ